MRKRNGKKGDVEDVEEWGSGRPDIVALSPTGCEWEKKWSNKICSPLQRSVSEGMVEEVIGGVRVWSPSFRSAQSHKKE